MKFSDDLKKKVIDPLKEKGITIEDDEAESALASALNQFTGAGTKKQNTTDLPMAIYLAVAALDEVFNPPETPVVEPPPVP